MRARILVAAGLLVAAILTVVLTAQPFGSEKASGRTKAAATKSAAAEPSESVEEVRKELVEPADALLSRWLYGADKNVDPGKFWASAAAQADELGAQSVAADPVAAGEPWQMVGPTSIGGRILDVVVDPKNADTVYAAAATGGVWKSTDAGMTFKPAWPSNLTQAVGALAIAPGGLLYAGTGEAGPGGGSITYGGQGVYQSADGGEHWKYIGLAETSRIGRIVVDPKNPARVFVAGTGPLYRHGGGRGLFLSEDYGKTWNKVLSGDNEDTGAVDVAIDPRNSKTVYASMWHNFREPDRRTYEGLGSGLYKSSDAGKTWVRIGTPFFGPRPDLGRVGVTVAPDGTVYANASGASGVYAGFYRSTDGGTTFSTGQPPTNPQNSFYVYGWWFGRIYVDPKDSNHVFQAALVLQESKDGGQSWANAPGSCGNICAAGHADQHGMAWDPKVPGRVYLGNDGGVFRSDSNGAGTNGGWVRAKYMPFSQINGMDVAEQDTSRMVVGLQDNGGNKNWRRTTDPGSQAPDDQWIDYTGGDGQRVRIAPDRKNLLYGCYQYGACIVSTDGGSTSTDFSNQVISVNKNWFTPIEFDPEDSHTIYTGGEIINRSDDDAQTFIPISPPLSNGPGRETNPLFHNYGTLTTIAPAGKSTGTIYAGTDDGNLWYTHDNGTTWTKASDPDLPKAWITRVEVDTKHPNTAYVSYSGFRQDDNAAYVLRTTDGGASWDNISANLPKAPVNDINVIGNVVVVASDVGVFFHPPSRKGWLRLGSDLPLSPVYELRYIPASETNPKPLLFAGTFGRGAYKIDPSVIATTK